LTPTKEEKMRIGIIGSGMIGSSLAKLWVSAGHRVMLSSRHPEELQPLAARLGERACAGSPQDAAKFGEVVLLSVPIVAIPDLARDLAVLLVGKTVLDTSNAYAKRDGDLARQAIQHPRGSAGWAAAMFPQSRWVKAFNTVYFQVLEKEAHRSGDRLGIPLAGDDAEALEVAAHLVRDAGFDPVIAGGLGRGREFEPQTRAYNTGMTAPDVQRVLAQP
jgi:predicted dinucleotide-binding enzyme